MELEALLRLRDPNMTGVVDKDFLAKRQASIIPIIIIQVLSMVLGTCGNILVIGCITRIKSLRTNSNLFILNLAIADLMVTAFVVPFNIVGALEGELFFYDKGWLCEAIGLVCLTSCLTSLFSICSISVNRYIFVCHRHTYKKLYTRRNCIIICSLSWLFGFFVGFPTSVGWGDVTYDRKTLACIYDRVADHSYTIFLFLCGVLIPANVVLFLYCKIYWVLKHSEMKLAEYDSVSDKRTTRKDRRESIRLARTIFFVLIAYIVCWIPYGFVVVIDKYDKFSADAHTYALLMAHMNSGVNFIIYGVTNTTFRRAYKKILRSWKIGVICFGKDASVSPTEGTNPTTGTCTSQKELLLKNDTKSTTVAITDKPEPTYKPNEPQASCLTTELNQLQNCETGVWSEVSESDGRQ